MKAYKAYHAAVLLDKYQLIPTLTEKQNRSFKQIDRLLDESAQVWLLGAGISKKAGIPLMGTLTDLVEDDLRHNGEAGERYKEVRQELPKGANVEGVLSHLGDLIALAKRSRNEVVVLSQKERSVQELQTVHRRILESIRSIIQWGCRDGDDGKVACKEGSMEVSIEYHIAFVEALYKRRRGPRKLRPVTFFTTNYDTLLEDALCHAKLSVYDGFTGGTVAYWNPGSTSSYNWNHPNESHSGHPYDGFDARLYKLHGSIDWVNSDGTVMRRREGAAYSLEGEELLIYPQATKYKLTQRDPFASLFSTLRRELCNPGTKVLVTCGYSFSDQHINEEIFRALRLSSDHLTLIAFLFERDHSNSPEDGMPNSLPKILRENLSEGIPCREQIIVATNLGIYEKSPERLHEREDGYNWWKFEGLTHFLNHGVDSLAQ